MQCAKPIIASNFGIVREYIESGVSGLLVDSFERQLPGYIAEITEDSKKFEKYGKAAYNTFETFFSFEQVSHRLSVILNE
jgi:glycosyltransferase involved in cell wall biosynthesis